MELNTKSCLKGLVIITLVIIAPPMFIQPHSIFTLIFFGILIVEVLHGCMNYLTESAECDFDIESTYSSVETYQKSQEYKLDNDYTNYWIRLIMSANAGHTIAINEIDHDLCISRLHMSQDYDTSLSFLERTKGYSYSAYYLGYMYYYGLGVITNKDRAKTLFEHAISLGNKTAMSHLGYMYLCDKEERRAHELIQRSGKHYYHGFLDYKNNKQHIVNYYYEINQSEKLVGAFSDEETIFY